MSVDVIAEKLHRHRSTIFRELRRNAFVDEKMLDLNGYYCVTANDMDRERRAKLRKLARFSYAACPGWDKRHLGPTLLREWIAGLR